MTSIGKLLTQEQAADYLGVSSRFFSELVDTGLIEAVQPKLGGAYYYTCEDIDAYVANLERVSVTRSRRGRYVSNAVSHPDSNPVKSGHKIGLVAHHRSNVV